MPVKHGPKGMRAKLAGASCVVCGTKIPGSRSDAVDAALPGVCSPACDRERNEPLPLTPEETVRVIGLLGRTDHPSGPDALAVYLPSIAASLNQIDVLKELSVTGEHLMLVHCYLNEFRVDKHGGEDIFELVVADAREQRRQVAALEDALKLLSRGPENCDCYHCAGRDADERGKEPCEYFSHHCAMCHEKGLCTVVMCRSPERVRDLINDRRRLVDVVRDRAKLDDGGSERAVLRELRIEQ